MAQPDERYPLEWIDEYVARIRPHVFVREEDGLLIKVPNEAHKLNPSGVRVLTRLLAGEGIEDVWRSYGNRPDVRRDLYLFFTGLKQVLLGCVNERRLPEAVVSKPFRLDFAKLPVLSEIALTYRCNLRCQFCYAGCSCRRSGQPEPEMSADAVRAVLRAIRTHAQVPSVSFTGGEPALRDDLPEFVAYAAQDLGLRVNLITNGTMIDDAMARALQSAGLASAQVSIEADEADVHDALTGVRGSHARSCAGLERLRAQGIHVHTNTTLNRLNLDAAARMPAFVKRLGLTQLSMNLVIPQGASVEEGHDINVRYSEIPDILCEVQAQAAAHDVEFMWYSPTPVCIFNPIQHRLGNKGCAACDGLLSVSPTGDVLPCSSWPEPVGNLLRDDFRAVWHSARASSLRAKEFAPALCRGCADFALCQGACPLYWRHFGYDELVTHGGAYAAAHG